MLQELLEKQRVYTDHFFDTIDLHPIEQLVDILLACSGIVFVTGIEKSGLVARKIAFTMVSTGTKAFYLSPTDAVHGDLGMVSSNDAFVMLSKSGESDELIQLATSIRNKGATLIGVVCNKDSRLSKACDKIITLPFQKELCPFDMAPTMSTTSQLLFGDLLAIALMKRKKYTIDEFAINHPSGRLGKRITFKVKDIMIAGEKIPTGHPKQTLRSALVELSNKRCGCIFIIDEEMKLLGIFTDGDLRRTLQKHGAEVLDLPMENLMTPNPRSIGPDVMAWDAMKQMEQDPQRRIMVLPVLQPDKRLVGLLHLHDIIQNGI